MASQLGMPPPGRTHEQMQAGKYTHTPDRQPESAMPVGCIDVKNVHEKLFKNVKKCRKIKTLKT